LGGAWERRELHINFCLRILKERDHSENLGVDEGVILEGILEK